MVVPVDEGLVMEIEARAVEMARGAGGILQGRFGRPLEVEYKDDKKEQDPVTSADKESQAYLSESIARHFPDHGIVGEEDSREDEAPVPEFLWILDPLDGTTNFLNGLPIYAVSIGVLHRGNPIAGALFIPWSGESGGVVLHARKGGGAWMDEKAISIPESETVKANRLTGLPASFGSRFRLGKDLGRRVGEVRITGSIAYELALTALGAFQYVVFGGPRIWDVAGGAIIVMEAGGAVMARSGKRRRWEPLTYLGPSWESGPPTMKEVRNWVAALIVANVHIAPFVGANLQGRHPLSARVARLMRRLRRKGR
jgi:myo-inositol-1(or 4)-monophosphatase